MLRTQSLFGNLKRAQKERFSFAVVSTVHVNPRQIVYAFSRRAMIRAENFLPNIQCALEERFGFRQVALVEVKSAEIIGDLRIMRAESFLADLQHARV